MFKGLFFFARESWKYDKRYIVYAALVQLIAALAPILAALMPKYLVEELMGARRRECSPLTLRFLPDMRGLPGRSRHFCAEMGLNTDAMWTPSLDMRRISG